MDVLLKYNPAYETNAQGLMNIGSTCYFNSLIQSLLSCTSIFETLEQNITKPHIANNILAQELYKFYSMAKKQQSIHREIVTLWKIVMGIAKGRKDRVMFSSGQQDAHEGLMIILDALDSIPEVKQLFLHRHNIEIYCDKCKKFVVNKQENNMVFEIQDDLTTEQHEKFANLDANFNKPMDFNKFVRKQTGYVDADYICPNGQCRSRGEKYRTTTLTLAPEILPMLIKKYSDKKIQTPFPETIEFITSDEKNKLVYRLVAQTEHSGSRGGGHYWAICQRKDGVKKLNDTSVSNGEFGPTLNTYVLFYHYDHMEKLF